MGIENKKLKRKEFYLKKDINLLVAVYELDGSHIFIKMKTDQVDEDLAIHLIGIENNVKITFASFLNID